MPSYVTLKEGNITIIALNNISLRKVYKIKNLARLFGDYPSKRDKDDTDE